MSRCLRRLEVSNPLKLEFLAIVSCLTSMLGPEPGSSAREVCTLNHSSPCFLNFSNFILCTNIEVVPK